MSLQTMYFHVISFLVQVIYSNVISNYLFSCHFIFGAGHLFQCHFKPFTFMSFHLWCRSFIPISFQYFRPQKSYSCHFISGACHLFQCHFLFISFNHFCAPFVLITPVDNVSSPEFNRFKLIIASLGEHDLFSCHFIYFCAHLSVLRGCN